MGEPIDVIWKSYHKPDIIDRGYWDQGLLEDIFKQGNFEHHYDFDWINTGAELPEERQGAIVIINGRTHIDDTVQINEDIAKLRWVLFIDTGDEESSFPWREIKHPIMRVWVMLPRMNTHDDVSFHLPNGYRPNTRDVLKQIGFMEKEHDWFFVGQLNHERRQQFFDVAQQFTELYPTSITRGTKGFGADTVPYENYMTYLAKSRIAPCPSGIESPDNFRLYEALEAGCLPVVDAFSTHHKSPGFWRYLFGDDIPFPVVDYWDAFPKLLPELLRDYPANANRCFAWWQLKKREIKYKLFDDVKELSK